MYKKNFKLYFSVEDNFNRLCSTDNVQIELLKRSRGQYDLRVSAKGPFIRLIHILN